MKYTEELREPFAYGYLRRKDDGDYAAFGEGLYEEGKVLPIFYEKEVGLFSCGRLIDVCGFASSWGLWYSQERLDGKRERFPEYKEFFDAMEETFGDRDTGKRMWAYRTERELKLDRNRSCWGGMAGHAILDFGGVMELGTSGMREKIAKYRRIHPYADSFYSGLERVLDMLDVIGDRTRAEAERMAAEAQDGEEKKHFLDLARALSVVPRNTPCDFLSAAQFFWLFFGYDGYDSPGRVDQIFWPYWQKTPREEALKILDGIWQGFNKHGSWGVCISGSDENGRDMTNEISFAMLDLVK
ncbi:MAG: hypothetical protein IKQ87_01400, partial [Clostridia bacterium]|nr:hypothetical protein [Clostridia bacterium]